MKHLISYILLLSGAIYGLHAQDKIVLRNGSTIEVHVQRSLENRVEYTYPGETYIYEKLKSAISYILYEDGRKEIFDENARIPSTDRTSSTHDDTSGNRASFTKNLLPDNDAIFWEDVKITYSESEVSRMSRLKRISAVSSINYKDAIQQLKKKAAAIGGTTILVMDVPESDSGNDTEVIGIAYRDENMEYTPRSTGKRNTVPAESSSNVRRRRIAQQMESYNNESNLVQDDNRNSSSRQTSSRENASSRQTYGNGDSPDAVYLMNGRVVRGTIEELEPDDFVSIHTSTGKVYEYSMDDVKRISRGSARGSASTKTSSSRSSSRYDDEDDRYDDRRYSSRERYNDRGYDNYSVSGYKGTFNAGYNLPMGGTGEKGSFEFKTSHGYQINEYLFVGAGLGLDLYNAHDPKMKDPNSYPQYVGTVTNGVIKPTDSVTYMHAVDSSYTTMPVFLDIRGYYPLQNSAITPFAMFRFGYAFNLSDGFGGMGLYMNPAVGIKYQLSPRIGINFSVGYSFQSYGGIPGKNGDGGYGYYYFKDETGKASNTKYEAKGAGSINQKLGIEF
ncbi:MAG: DUF4156 domain-containing protein [Tannerella sp.]|jgi:hypothetical protein|nr:DUF4156 domain-containing protein [Tannerella sp.]